ncbi:unnamed protein product [Amoebophrya sp. A25]|nr:unnamed protein product [Amoebophrya sp. A25]|eukprot:GSA25T00002654001.1
MPQTPRGTSQTPRRGVSTSRERQEQSSGQLPSQRAAHLPDEQREDSAKTADTSPSGKGTSDAQSITRTTVMTTSSDAPSSSPLVRRRLRTPRRPVDTIDIRPPEPWDKRKLAGVSPKSASERRVLREQELDKAREAAAFTRKVAASKLENDSANPRVEKPQTPRRMLVVAGLEWDPQRPDAEGVIKLEMVPQPPKEPKPAATKAANT